MPRNLDMTAMRSFVAVADTGGVTRAAGHLNLTQSAVSMQLKRLEESMGIELLDRSARQIGLTASGEQLLGYARRMLDLNDEAFGRLTAQEFEGEVTLGVPHDIVYLGIPQVLRLFNAEYPRVRVNLVSSFTNTLKQQFESGALDAILTTETGCDAGGETLRVLPLVWIGAPNGVAWRQRPLRLAFERRCIFRSGVQSALDAAGIPWEMSVESDQSRAIDATVSADLAINARLAGTVGEQLEVINHQNTLPELTTIKVNFYARDLQRSPVVASLASMVRTAYSGVARAA